MADSFIPDRAGSDSFLPDAKPASPASSGVALSPKESGYWSARARGDKPAEQPTPPPRSIIDRTLNPQGLGEHLASLGITIPATMLTGGAAGAVGAAPVLGRIGAQAAIGALAALNRGDSMTVGALMDGAIAGLTEGASKLATVGRIPFLMTKSLADTAEPIRGFEYARKAVLAALDLVRDRLPNIKFEIPVLGKGKLSPDQAAKLISESKGSDYWLGVSQLADALKKSEAAQLLMSGQPKPLGMNAGQIFRRAVKPERFEPPTRAKWADRAVRAIDNPVTKSAADSAATQHVSEYEGWPAALVGLLGASPESLGSIAGRMGRH